MSGLYKPSELHDLLKSWGISAKRTLSQNFLIDQNIIDKILAVEEIHPGDPILEIGPGPGALTEALLKKGAAVVCVEMDPLFATALARLKPVSLHPRSSLHIEQTDFLKFPLSTLFPKKKFRVVANLPYHITTPILTKLLPLTDSISSLVVMVQKEFADRMIAQVSTKNYSRFTLFCQFYAAVVKKFSVRPNSFYPPPQVHSAVVHCQLHPPPLDLSPTPFFTLIQTAFHQRRKMLRSSLNAVVDPTKIEHILSTLGKSPQSRPENLSLDDWAHFYRSLPCPFDK